MVEELPVRDALLSFAAREPLRAALFLTYSFDGPWFEDAIIADLCERSITTMLVVRDRNAITSEAPSVRYRKANACSSVIFHPKLALLIADNKARAVISSANLTRGGFERQRELGRVFNLGPSEVTDRGLFESLVEYLRDGVATEVRGDAARDLADTARALHEVVGRYKAQPRPASHVLLHNYSESIWTQVLKMVPHRVLKRAVIVSPFFEPDRRHPEDPPLGAQDASIFARMLLQDFEFEPPKGQPSVRVFFRQSEGRTELPVRKLKKFKNKIAFFAQDEREQRLHAKLLLFEGAEGKGRKPFLLALYGSPNFTTAGLINRPPKGNSELAVLTTFPIQRKSLDRVTHMLGFERGFNQVQDLSILQSEKDVEPPEPISLGAADVTYRVAEQTLKVSLIQNAPIGARIRVLVQRDGSWVVIGETAASGIAEVVIPVTGMSEVDGRTSLFEIRCFTVRIEIVGPKGDLLAQHLAPINVDVPETFCGLTMVGSALLTLDERIARAGLGIPLTYRQQLKWLEARKAEGSSKSGPAVVTHQADLDRFYRNIHQGLRGILTRVKANPGSEFSVRRSLEELIRWVGEAATGETTVMSRECRVFLLERLIRGICAIVDNSSAAMKSRIPAIAVDLLINERLVQVLGWLDQLDEPAIAVYAAASRSRIRHILNTFKNLTETQADHRG